MDRPEAQGPPIPGRIVLSSTQIERRVHELAQEIGTAYSPDTELLVLGLLKGSFIFLADLVRQIPLPTQVDFMVASSYGNATTSSGDVQLLYKPGMSIKGRDILLVEDIVDSGNTLAQLLPLLEEQGVASIETCVLLHKRIANLGEYEPKWTGFDSPPGFLAGYGLDYAEKYRALPHIVDLGRPEDLENKNDQ